MQEATQDGANVSLGEEPLTNGIFRWYSGRSMGNLGSVALERRLENSLQILEKQGMRIPQGCRALNALNFLRRLNDGEIDSRRRDSHFLGLLAAHHRTAWELFQIVYAAVEDKNNWRLTPFTRGKIAAVLRGPDLKEARDTSARDAQFELIVAAQLRLGGIGVYAGEPDLRFDLFAERVGIAAKRVRSLSARTLRERVKAAISQIVAQNIPGFVALNLDSRFRDVDLRRPQSELEAEFTERFDQVARYNSELAREPLVLGAFLFGYGATYEIPDDPEATPALRISSPFRILRLGDDPTESARFERFVDRWRESLAVHVDYMASPRLGKAP